jgi:BolA protein
MEEHAFNTKKSKILEEKLSKIFLPEYICVVDESHKHAGHAGSRPEGGTHFHITMVSADFLGKPLVERHRLLYDALQEELKTSIHALSATLKTPRQITT